MLRKKVQEISKRFFEPFDPKPVAIPVGFKRPPTLQEQIQQMIRTQISAQAAMNGQESFEEAEDFDVDDDFDPMSPWEQDFEAEAIVQEKLQAKKRRPFREEKPIEKKPKTEPQDTKES